MTLPNELREIADGGNLPEMRVALRKAAREIDRLSSITSIDVCPFYYHTRKPVSEKLKTALHNLLETICTPTQEQMLRRKALRWFRGAAERYGQ